MGIFRWLHRRRAMIAAVLLAGALLLAERPYTLIIQICLWAAVVAVAYEFDAPERGRLLFWTLFGVLGSVLVLLAYGGIFP